MKEQNQDFFVGVDNPMDIRRNLLESSRELIQTLQSYEKIKKIRELKIKRIKQLRTVGKELDMLFSKLKDTLPKTHLRAKVVEPAKTKIKKKKGINTLDNLEVQLKDIEREISRIS
ncbi:hypothetical protein GF327_03450 [Candidatus Woesearchaeota archaeon]|nr:hypothetical protein [Candidatus Woesearchaeota archaeon]